MQKNPLFCRPTYPIFFQTVTGNKQFLFLGLTLYSQINPIINTLNNPYNYPNLMAMWSKVLPLTASFLSPLSGVQIPPWACEKVASDFMLGSGFRRVLRFPPPNTTG